MGDGGPGDAMAIRVAATLRIADHVAQGLRTAPELAEAVNADPDALDRVLSHLSTEGLFTRDRSGRYALTPRGRLFRRAGTGPRRADPTRRRCRAEGGRGACRGGYTGGRTDSSLRSHAAVGFACRLDGGRSLPSSVVVAPPVPRDEATSQTTTTTATHVAPIA